MAGCMLESQSVPLSSELGENCWLGIGMFLNVDSVILFFSLFFTKRDFLLVVFQLLIFFLFELFYQTNHFFGESQWFK